MSKTLVILNEQHTLLPEQQKILDHEYGQDGWELFNVPAEGWTLKEMGDLAIMMSTRNVVFVSPIPALMKLIADRDVCKWDGHQASFRVFHNDRREKKELPNGKVIMTVAKEGWELV